MIDTSIWIDYFRDTDKELNDFIDCLINEDRVNINGIIKSEILIGTKTQKEYNLVNNSLNGIKTIDFNDQVFNETSDTGFKLKRKGITVPLSDLIIAVQSYYNRLILIEKDNHFKKIKGCLDITLYFHSKVKEL
ncbi:PIN domain-containing protein [Acidobacteriota bacterium]